MGGSDETRANETIKSKAKWKAQNIRNWQPAKDIQQSGSEQALKAMHSAHAYFGRALTCATMKPRYDSTNKKYVYPSNSEVPRQIGLQIVVNYVAKTPCTGAKLAPMDLRAPKPIITLVSTCPEDAEKVLEVLNDSRTTKHRSKYTKIKLYGTGKSF